jgi:hypothetical protein
LGETAEPAFHPTVQERSLARLILGERRDDVGRNFLHVHQPKRRLPERRQQPCACAMTLRHEVGEREPAARPEHAMNFGEKSVDGPVAVRALHINPTSRIRGVCQS